MKSTAWLRVVLVLVVLIGLGAALLQWAVSGIDDLKGLALNLGTEMIGAAMTYVLIELFIGGRERREAKKADLIAQMGRSVKDVAIAAAEELRQHGWLYDGSLRGAKLMEANLQGAKLYGANLRETVLVSANLQGADLRWTDLRGAGVNGTDLSGADLSWANLQGAILYEADLQGTNLFSTNLQGANLQRALLFEAILFRANLLKANLFGAGLQGADLSGANLQRAILQGADLEKAKLHVDTVLPDGKKWTPGTDMARFTDPDHPDFWHPDAR